MVDVDGAEPLSDTSDSSFIILGQGSCPPSIDNEAIDVVGASEKDGNTFAFFESSKSASNRNTPSRSFDQSKLEDDIQEKVNQLVRENHRLKETLSQNNLAIKSQLDTFYMWQQEVLKTHETHKQKFSETRDFILKLQTENLNLKRQLEEASCSIGDGDSFIQINKKCDVDSLKEETDKIKNAFQDMVNKNEMLEMENVNLKEKLKGAEKEILKLNSELEDVVRENRFLKQTNEKASVRDLTHGSLPNSEARAQISNLFKQLEMEREKTSNLKEKLRKANEIMSKARNPSVSEEVDEYLKNLDDLNVSFDCQNQRYNSLQSWVTLAEENLKEENPNSATHSLLGEIKKLKCYINQEEKTSKEKQGSIQELKDQFRKLLEDYKALQQQLSLIENKDLDCEKYKSEVSSLSQQLESKEQELLLKHEECDKLKEEVRKLNLECEGMAILRVQVELYQNDFNEERAAREKLVGEKEEMAERVRHLQSMLEALEKGSGTERPEGKPKEPDSVFVPYEWRKDKLVCPKCFFRFSNDERCEEHISDCLNNEFSNF